MLTDADAYSPPYANRSCNTKRSHIQQLAYPNAHLNRKYLWVLSQPYLINQLLPRFSLSSTNSLSWSPGELDAQRRESP